MEDSGSGHRQLHFVLLPWLGTSHTIPMIDIGRMLAERSVAVTVVMTPANAARLSPTISHIADSGLAIRFVTLPFPSAEAGLPEGCESFDSLPSFDMVPNLYYASKLLRHPLEVLLRDLTVAPSCIVSGMFYSWTPAVARELGVPCFIFHGFGAFALFCMHNLYCYKPHESVSSPTEPFTIPDLPFPFEITRQRLPIQFQLLPRFMEMCEDGQKPSVSFGSLARFAPAQLMELGHGLLASRRPFIWVINGAESLSEEVEQWLQEKLEIKEVDSRCLLIRGWAPQVMILSHPAVGGFMTHSGWNSTLESASAGVPVASWPLFADQFINQKLIVDVLGLGIGVAVGVDTSVELKQAPEDGASVTRDEVAEAIERLMGGGEEGEERRRKAKELAEEARKAVAKCGSSYDNLTLLIESVAQKAKKN